MPALALTRPRIARRATTATAAAAGATLARALAALLATALATAEPAAAAAPWSAPAAVPGSPATAPTVAFNAGGVGVLTGDTGGGASSGAVGPNTVGARADDADGFPGPITAFTATNFALGNRLALYGLGRIVGMGTHFSSADDRAGIVFGDAGDKLTNVHFVGPTDRPGAAQALAANTRGDVAATFGVCNNGACAHQSLFLVVRRSGGSVQSSLRMDNVAVRNLSTVAINDRGDMLVAWQANGGVFARIRTAGGTLYDTERLGNPGEPVRAISAVLTPNRGAAVAWEAQSVDEGTPESPATVDASTKAAGASHHFRSSQRLGRVPTLATGQYVGERAVKVVRSADGRITAAWTAFAADRFVVQAAGLSGARFRTGATVSDPAVDSILADLDAGPSSELAVAWRTGVAGTDAGTGTPGLSAALRSPGGSAFAAPEAIEQGAAAFDPTLRFDPSSGAVVTAWNDLASMRTATRPALVPPSG
jgi:hypothetical protein